MKKVFNEVHTKHLFYDQSTDDKRHKIGKIANFIILFFTFVWRRVAQLLVPKIVSGLSSLLWSTRYRFLDVVTPFVTAVTSN